MDIDQQQLDEMNLQFVVATQKFSMSDRETLMRDYAKSLNKGGLEGARSWIRTLELSEPAL